MSVTVRPSLCLQVPGEVLAQLGWTDTTDVSLSVEGDALVLRAVHPGAASSLTGAALAALGFRIDLGITRGQFARVTQIPYDTVTQWEEGTAQPTAEQFAIASEAHRDASATLEKLRQLEED